MHSFLGVVSSKAYFEIEVHGSEGLVYSSKIMDIKVIMNVAKIIIHK